MRQTDRQFRQRLVAAGAYGEYCRRRRVTGSDEKYRHHNWTRDELGALLLHLTARELSVMLGRTLPGVEQKIEAIKSLLAYRAGLLTRAQMKPERRRQLDVWLKPGYHGKFAAENLTWLIDGHGLEYQTFRQHDQFGCLIPTLVKKRPAK